MRTPTAAAGRSSIRNFIRHCLAAVLCVAAAGALAQGRMERDGVVIHWGLMAPCSMAQRLAFEEMHGGRPTGGGKLHHLVLALSDARTGQRIDGAIVRAQLSEPGVVDDSPKYLPLMTMNMSEQPSYGQLFGMVGNGPYRFKVMVKLPNHPRDIEYVISAASLEAAAGR